MENDNSKRLMLFFMLTLGFMLVWSRLFPAPPPKKPVQRPTASRNLKQSPSSRPAGQRGATPQAQASSKPTSANSTQPSSRATSLAATSSTHKQDQLKAKPIPEKSLTVERKLLTMKVSNRGGGLTRLSLKRFYNPKSKEKKPLELIHPKLRRQPPFREHFVDKALLAALRPGAQHNKKSISYTSMSQTENAIVLKRTLPLRKGGSILLEKRYVFGKKEYAFSVQYKIKNQSLDSIRPSMRFVLSDYINRQTMNKGGMFSGTPDTFEALCMKKNEKRPVRHAYESLLKGPQKQDGSIDYIAV
ncbi:MAG: membrane protein insertase YidC, partial [Myxococcota bacterium]